MDRRAFIRAIVLITLCVPLAAEAQPAARVYRIGYLAMFPNPASREAFRQGLRDLGWVEGQNIAIEYRYAHGRLEQLVDLAAELVRLKVDLIVTVSPQPVQAAKEATTTVPIVMVAVADPVTYGFITSLARPGGNITGVSLLFPELGAKRLELLREMVPKLSRAAVLWNAANPFRALDLKVAQAGARALGVTLQSLEVRGPDDFDRAFEAASRERARALITLEDPLTVTHRTRIVGLAAKHRLPALYGLREFVDAGGLMSYAPILLDNFRRAATYVDKILKGANPADLPVEQPTKFELVINMKTAKALGLTIPPSVLGRADQVIE